MKWIDSDTVLEIHRRVIETTGGSYGVRNKNTLESALYAPLATFDKQEVYPDFFEKVAVLLFGMASNHPFVDGNKRTAFVVALTVFAVNGYTLKFTQEEVVTFMFNVAGGNSNYPEIQQWFKDHEL